MRKKFFKGSVPKILGATIKGGKKLKKDPVSKMLRDPKMVIKAPTKEMKEAKEQFKKLWTGIPKRPLTEPNGIWNDLQRQNFKFPQE